MSLNQSVFIGPYVACKFVPGKRERKYLACAWNLCRLFDHEVQGTAEDCFCRACGSPLNNMSETVPGSSIDIQEVRDKLNETLFLAQGDDLHEVMLANNCHIWLSNLFHKNSGIQIYCEEKQSSINEITSIDITTQIRDFTNNYDKELAILHSIYGKTNVEVKWGTISMVC